MRAELNAAEIISSVADLPHVPWNDLCRGRPNASYGWLRTVAESAVAPPDYRFFLVYERGKLVGAAACYLTDERGGNGGFDRRLYARAAPIARAMRFGVQPALICGVGDAHGGTGLLISPYLEPAASIEIGRKLVDVLEKYVREHRRTLVFHNVLETDPWRSILRERGYARGMVPPSVVLPAAWADFSEYLSYIKSGSRNAFRNIKKELNHPRTSGTEIRRIRAGAEGTEEAYRLLAAHYRFKNQEPFPFNTSFLENLRKNCGDDAALYLAVTNGHLAAAAVTVAQADTIWNAFVGMNREIIGQSSAYFHVLFYAPMQHAVCSGAREIVVGPGAYDSKLIRGGRLVRRYVFVKQLSCWPQVFTRRALRLREQWHARKYAELYARDHALGARRAGRDAQA